MKPTWSPESFTDLDAEVRNSLNRIRNSPFIPHKNVARLRLRRRHRQAARSTLLSLNFQRLYEYRFRNVDQNARTAVWAEIGPFIHRYLVHAAEGPRPGRGPLRVPELRPRAGALGRRSRRLRGELGRARREDARRRRARARPAGGLLRRDLGLELPRAPALPGGGRGLPRADARAARARRADRDHGPELPLLREGVLRHGGSHGDPHPRGRRGAPVRGGLRHRERRPAVPALLVHGAATPEPRCSRGATCRRRSPGGSSASSSSSSAGARRSRAPRRARRSG